MNFLKKYWDNFIQFWGKWTWSERLLSDCSRSPQQRRAMLTRVLVSCASLFPVACSRSSISVLFLNFYSQLWGSSLLLYHPPHPSATSPAPHRKLYNFCTVVFQPTPVGFSSAWTCTVSHGKPWISVHGLQKSHCPWKYMCLLCFSAFLHWLPCLQHTFSW